jgi:hypothetical protein
MNLSLAVSTVLAMAALTSMWLIGQHKAAGWVIAVAAQLLWVPYGIWLIRQYPLVAITFVSVPVYLHGWRSFLAGQGKSASFRPGRD